jgi:hypothetical protein
VALLLPGLDGKWLLRTNDGTLTPDDLASPGMPAA